MAEPHDIPLDVHDEFIDEILADETLEEHFPGLRQALEFADTKKNPDARSGFDDAVPESSLSDTLFRPSYFIRTVLGIIRTTKEFQEARAMLSEDVQKKLDDFLDGKPLFSIFPKDRSQFAVEHPEAANDASAPTGAPALKHFTELSQASSRSSLRQTEFQTADQIPFQNWGQTVSNTPSQTSVPDKIDTIIGLVQQAKNNNKRIRAAGYRHTWTDMYSQDGAAFISMLDINTVTKLPDFASIEKDPDYGGNELKGIELAPDPLDPDVAYVRLGAAVTNEDFRRWAIDPQRGASKWTVPIQVIMVEITFGGSNAPICHGAGINSKTLSDLVVGVEYIDANGVKRELADRPLLRAAAGCFGLLGIVTSITLKLDPMTAANFDPRTEDLILAIPPPQNYRDKLPKDLQKRFDKFSAKQLEDARTKFIDTAENRYYSEWFWFPYQEKAFINAWDNSTDTSGWVNYPDKLEVFIQWLSNWGGGVLNDMKIFRILSPKTQAAIMGTFAMLTMPHKQVKTQLINALHFRRGIQNMRVGDFEVEIPIPANEKSGATTPTPNWDLVQKAWWDGIIAMYNDTKNVSARIALEMRVTGHSDIILAPQSGNKLGTASIEVITSMPAVEDPKGIWKDFKQTLANIWLNYEDADGKKLRVRPHWAKEWSDTKAFGQDWVDYLRETHYKNEIPEFKETLRQIGVLHDWELKDIQARFSNPFLDRLIFA